MIETSSPPTDLQKRLMRSIVDYIRQSGLGSGDPLNQLLLAQRLGVSRTPIRAALQHLDTLGIVRVGDGVHVVDPDLLSEAKLSDPVEEIITAISRDRHKDKIGIDVTENDLMRRYGASRAQIMAALRRMAALGMVARKPGFGWRFEPTETREARMEGYRIRLLVEPAMLIEPSFLCDSDKLREIRNRHREFLDRAWRADLAVEFFEANAEFHLTLAKFSNNRYFVQVINQQIGLRRLRNYSWSAPPTRVTQSTTDHIAVMDALLEGDQAKASNLLRHHIATTMDSYL